MRLSRLRCRGHAHLEDFDLNVDALPAGLVAVCGGNGAGKSSLLNLFPGALYRATPSGPLKERMTARDAFVEASVVNGQPWTIRHLVDGQSGKGASSVVDADGEPVIESGQNRAYDTWATKTLPSEDVFYTSVFSSQGSQGFAALRESARKAIILRVVGVERLEAQAEKAREQLRLATVAKKVLVARLDDERSRSSKKHDLLIQIESTKANSARLAAEATRLAEDIVAAEAEVHSLTIADEQIVVRAKLEAQVQQCDVELADVRRRMANNEGLLLRKAEIEAAVTKVDELNARVSLADEDLAAALVLQRRSDTAYTDAVRDREAARQELARFEQELAEALTKSENAQKSAALTAEIAALRCEEKNREVQSALTHLMNTIGAGQTLRDRRLGNSLQSLRAIASRESHPLAEAKAALARDDDMVFQADVGAQAEAQRAYDIANDVYNEASKASARLYGLFWALPSAEEAARTQAFLDGAEAVRSAKASNIQMAELCLATRYDALTAADGEVAALKERKSGLMAELADLASLTKLAAPLSVAEERLVEYASAIESISGRRERLRSEMPEACEPSIPGKLAQAREEVSTLSAALAARRNALETYQHLLGRHEASLEAAQASAVAVEQLQQDIVVADTDVADWTRIAHALGRDGLQAIAVSDAAPELSERANAILAEAFGSRFTVTFETLRSDAKGTKELETFDVRVHDSERNRVGHLESFSGGERVILGESISLALAAMSCAGAEMSEVTLVRDESGAALDEANGPRYIAMLRRAAQMVGAKHCFFVSHSRALQQLADSTIHVDGGKVSLQ